MGRDRATAVPAARWLLVLSFIVAGCAGPLEPGRLPTDEERCAFQGGSFRAGICHTRGGP
jgi:hypothetical protein